MPEVLSMKTKMLVIAMALLLAGCAQEAAHRGAGGPGSDVGETGIGGTGTSGTTASGAGRSGVGVDRQPATGSGSLTNRTPAIGD
jgi:hypothetical protein